jgi:hypothetical protein
MCNDYLPGSVGAAIVVVEFLNSIGAVIVTIFFDNRVDGHGEFAVEDTRAVFAIDVNVVFAKAWIDEVHHGFEILVSEDSRGAEDNKVKVEDSNGVIEVGLSENEVE